MTTTKRGRGTVSWAEIRGWFDGCTGFSNAEGALWCLHYEDGPSRRYVIALRDELTNLGLGEV